MLNELEGFFDKNFFLAYVDLVNQFTKLQHVLYVNGVKYNMEHVQAF